MPAPKERSGDLAGRVLGGQFRLEYLLGRGGMGEVYCAEQLEVGRRVVIKLLNTSGWSNTELEQRFRREARVLAQLNHPNIVQLYSFGRTEDGIAYLAMEYIEGRTLSKLISAEGPLPEPRVLALLEQICTALIEAHRCGIVHRDLKPDNVMIVERDARRGVLVKVLDFGIAKLTRAPELRITRPGAILGTPQYMAPEQLREGPIDERTDIYALGLIGYELLTAKVPFEGDNTVDLMLRVIREPVVPPSRKLPAGVISPACEALIVRCLAKEPLERFASAGELHDALLAIQHSEPRQEPLRLREADLQTERNPALPRRRGPLAAVVAGLLLLLAAGGSFVWFRSRELPVADGGGELLLREWVQGMPFPKGTEYRNFTATSVEAHVAAPRERVIDFYRSQIGQKWGAFQDLGAGLIVTNPDAPIKSLSVTSARDGSRLFIERR
jgi:serine/threonine protein kinase